MATTSQPAASAAAASRGPERSSASRRETDVEMVSTAVRMGRSLVCPRGAPAARVLRRRRAAPALRPRGRGRLRHPARALAAGAAARGRARGRAAAAHEPRRRADAGRRRPARPRRGDPRRGPGARSAMDEHAGVVRGAVRVAATAADAVRLPEVLAAFHREHPGVRIALRQASAAEALELVRRGAVDLAVLSLAGDAGGLDGDAARRGAAAADRRARRPAGRRGRRRGSASCSGRPFVLAEPGSALRATVMDACQAAGFSPVPLLEVGDPSAVRFLVGAGLGRRASCRRRGSRCRGRRWASPSVEPAPVHRVCAGRRRRAAAGGCAAGRAVARVNCVLGRAAREPADRHCRRASDLGRVDPGSDARDGLRSPRSLNAAVRPYSTAVELRPRTAASAARRRASAPARRRGRP